jgi:hypothetical protein
MPILLEDLAAAKKLSCFIKSQFAKACLTKVNTG